MERAAPLLIIREEEARRLVTVEAAIAAVEDAFARMAKGGANNYPVVRETVGYADAVFGVKAGADRDLPLLGLKAGGYWPGNLTRGLTNHQSTTLLFDPGSGRASALVSANYLTGVRTGAASAIAAKYLSRPDSRRLAIIGAGAQALHQLKAMLAVRPIADVRGWDPSRENLSRLAKDAAALGLRFEATTGPREAVEGADIIVTVTPSKAAIVERDWVAPGAHISAMGADTRGKQELDSALVARAALFVDELAQAFSIGEFQHAYAAKLITESAVRGTLGDVVAGLREGRRTAQEITIFDGTGVALQDLAVARLAAELAEAQGAGEKVRW